ncbi:MAG TPA: CHAT domain-containing protein [Acidimicrobiales bacterium]|nr:CHAT domain-containing protein [Acidimicrobiales bacterium]
MGDSLTPGPADTIQRALSLAEVDPKESLRLVGEAHKDGLPPGDLHLRGLASWAEGRAERHLGHRHEAGGALRVAVDLLAECGDLEASSRAAVSLALERIDAGRFDEAIRLLESASPHLSGAERARLLIQRGLAMQRSGRVVDSLDCWNQAVDASVAAGVPVEEAIARQNRGIVEIYRGEIDAAERDIDAARRSFTAAGQTIRAMEATHNLGFAASRRGDLPRALALFDQAQAQAGRLGAVRPQALVDRVEVTLDGGLVGEGRALAESAVRLLQQAGFDADVPEACLLAARACGMDGDLDQAAEWAAQAARLFEAQARPRWHLLARLSLAVIDSTRDPRSSEAPGRLIALAGQLRGNGWFGPAVEADARAAHLLIEQGQLSRAAGLVDRLTASVASSGALSRMQIRLVQARYLLAVGDGRRARRAMVSAYRALRVFQSTLGSIELRSRGGGRADELVAVGVGLATLLGSPDEALYWSEAVRQTTRSAATDAAPDPELLGLLARLRDVTAESESGPPSVAAATRVRKRQAALEELIRRHSRHTRGGDGQSSLPRLDRLKPCFTQHTLVDYVVVGDRLWSVVVEKGESRLVELADMVEVRRLVAGLRLALRIAVSGEDRLGTAEELLEAGTRAEQVLVTPLGLEALDRVVVIPDGPLTSVPWALLPSLAGAELVVAQSASRWAEPGSRMRLVPADTRVLVVAGPGLQHADEEIDAIRRTWPRVTTLAGAGATVANVLAGLASADLLHVAAHGTHRGDNPLLSGIRLHDGYLNGYELTTVATTAGLVVLSCCDTGMGETGSGLGLAQVLTQTGVASAIASVSPIPDRSAAELTTRLHSELAAGASPAAALCRSRLAVGGAHRFPTSAGLVCFGRS